ncbi:hypothetical protein VP01_186g3 [Puccinia sorghi]|uniref:Uncharacterized protein n=1 Tax=Puccinia sorghi TaxID=27349 RepID=A0A0L6VF42_9BASI|nr:hypothetical protein VP01_186g3 [Puccinia sorghi]
MGACWNLNDVWRAPELVTTLNLSARGPTLPCYRSLHTATQKETVNVLPLFPLLYPKTPAPPHPQLGHSRNSSPLPLNSRTPEFPPISTPCSTTLIPPSKMTLVRPLEPPKPNPPSNSPPALSPLPTEACLFRRAKSKVNLLSLTKALKIISFVYFGPPQLSACTMSSAEANAETCSYCLTYISSTASKLKLPRRTNYEDANHYCLVWRSQVAQVLSRCIAVACNTIEKIDFKTPSILMLKLNDLIWKLHPGNWSGSGIHSKTSHVKILMLSPGLFPWHLHAGAFSELGHIADNSCVLLISSAIPQKIFCRLVETWLDSPQDHAPTANPSPPPPPSPCCSTATGRLPAAHPYSPSSPSPATLTTTLSSFPHAHLSASRCPIPSLHPSPLVHRWPLAATRLLPPLARRPTFDQIRLHCWFNPDTLPPGWALCKANHSPTSSSGSGQPFNTVDALNAHLDKLMHMMGKEHAQQLATEEAL